MPRSNILEPWQINSQHFIFCRDQAFVVIEVNNADDEKPEFVIPPNENMVIAYPTDEALQKVVGPVITLQVCFLLNEGIFCKGRMLFLSC